MHNDGVHFLAQLGAGTVALVQDEDLVRHVLVVVASLAAAPHHIHTLPVLLLICGCFLFIHD